MTSPERMVLLAACSLALGAGCYSERISTCKQEDQPTVRMEGLVLITGTQTPVPDAHVAVELCGRYTDNPDPSQGHPNYLYVATADAQGRFAIDVPKGPAGLHVFFPGYRYGTVEVADTSQKDVIVPMAPLLERDQKPVVSDFQVRPTTARPGEILRFSANVVAPNVRDPLSEEVVLFELKGQAARAMAPPVRGVPGKGFANGIWTATIAAPDAPGDYVYSIGISTEQCITADRPEALVVSVRP